MPIFIHERPPKRRFFGKTVSFALHAAALAYVTMPPNRQAPPPATAYDRFIKPNEKKLVWYRFKDKLPESKPEEKSKGPAKAAVKAGRQNLVVRGGKKADQMIWQPLPKVEVPQQAPSPNLIAMRLPLPPPPRERTAKLFVPPREALREAIPDLLPEAPKLDVARTADAPALDDNVRDALKNRPKFVPPERPEPLKSAELPQAPQVQVAANSMAPALDAGLTDALKNRPQGKAFRPNLPPRPQPAQPRLPQVPEVQVASNGQAPALDAGLADALKNRPQGKAFRPALPPRSQPTQPRLPQAPKVQVAANGQAPALDTGLADALKNRPQGKAFRPSLPPRPPPAQPRLPQAPAVQVAANGQAPALDAGLADALKNRPQGKAFRPALPPRPQPTQPRLPQAPEVQVAANGSAPALDAGLTDALNNRPQPRAFRPPEKRVERLPPVLEDAPAMIAAAGRADVNAAIVGLRPAPRLDAPLPEGARPAEFSSGPRLNPESGAGESKALLSVPGLTVADPAPEQSAERRDAPVLMARAAPTSPENLAAAARTAVPPPVITQGDVTALRVSTAPDGRLEGRVVYTLAVQMPNITSYWGSWMLWFAERHTARGGLQPPVPLRKVDPRYVPSAVEEKVEGKVQLSAVIRSDGTVSQVAVLQPLDPRLDFAASEALSKWLFQPATRDGTPVDVDAVVEVPFRLAPVELRYRR
jgi:TonB family protein